ncbi:hypothetical protein HDA32_005370 [Spinactinospora alkalitolerans]|uniref:DUF2637 domain-containing protein n=1 Tax=Spinactinospora alkalitolerans TaxID=687207 RepID=A0A852U8J9_9ACTN|nr:DUF2637 domain-containing protein [Spinactinospora alkalitolerans]NYE50250.1 hypothetical protein [Spinactinospora alkalitolerans]
MSSDSKTVPWVAFVAGAAVSIGANVLHATNGPGPMDAGRVAAAAWAPVALLLVAEMVTRSRQRGSRWIVALRWVGTAIVAGVAAVVSYGHMRDLLISYGEDPLVAYLLPLSVDGLVLVASIAIAGGSEQRQDDGRAAAGPAVVEPAEPESTVTAAAVEQAAEPAPEPAPATALTVGLDEATERVIPVAAAADPAAARRRQRRQSRRQEPARLSAEEAAARAAELIAAADSAGREITGSEIGAECQRSQSWGRTVLREHRQNQRPDPAEVDGSAAELPLVGANR